MAEVQASRTSRRNSQMATRGVASVGRTFWQAKTIRDEALQIITGTRMSEL
jgi:hypothetical protein